MRHVLLLLLCVMFSFQGQSQKGDTATVELGWILRPVIYDHHSAFTYRPADVRGGYFKIGIGEHHRIRSRLAIFSGETTFSLEYGGEDEFRGHLMSLGYEFELDIWWWFSGSVGLEYFNKLSAHEGFFVSDSPDQFGAVHYDERITVNGLNVPVGLNLTLWKHLRVGLELSFRIYHQDYFDAVSGRKISFWRRRGTSKEGHFYIGVRF